MFKQFAITIVIAVVLSGIVALTLTPALCALLLKRFRRGAPDRVLRRVQSRLRAASRTLRRASAGASCRPAAWIAVFAVLLALAVVLWRRVPSGFIPTEDKGFFVLAVQLPDARLAAAHRRGGRAGRGDLPAEPVDP